jgi:hypothetical protein
MRQQMPRKQFPVLWDLLRDFETMAMSFIMLFEDRLKTSTALDAEQKWQLRHEVLDKLTREWHLIYSLAAAARLRSSFLSRFDDYIEQAIKDIGLTDARGELLLIPTFGENFSLVNVPYSSRNIAILNLPVSVVHSPWELSVIWHELAGLKVIKIRQKIEEFLPEPKRPGPPLVFEPNLMDQLFQRIEDGTDLDAAFMQRVRDFLTAEDNVSPQPDEIWSRDWFEQLYEDACSVFAFGEEFVSVLHAILRRQEHRITADRKHPDLATRLAVARRLLALQKGNAPPPASHAERLTDTLLWRFIEQNRYDPVAALPVADADPERMPEVRRYLVDQMKDFNQTFGDLDGGTIYEEHFKFSEMVKFGDKASKEKDGFPPDQSAAARIEENLLERFGDDDVDHILDKPFSPEDELTFAEHTHRSGRNEGVRPQRKPKWPRLIMYINSNHGGHQVIHIRHT